MAVPWRSGVIQYSSLFVPQFNKRFYGDSIAIERFIWRFRKLNIYIQLNFFFSLLQNAILEHTICVIYIQNIAANYTNCRHLF